jgi:hypothetical protein
MWKRNFIFNKIRNYGHLSNPQPLQSSEISLGNGFSLQLSSFFRIDHEGTLYRCSSVSFQGASFAENDFYSLRQNLNQYFGIKTLNYCRILSIYYSDEKDFQQYYVQVDLFKKIETHQKSLYPLVQSLHFDPPLNFIPLKYLGSQVNILPHNLSQLRTTPLYDQWKGLDLSLIVIPV